ncbi:hypothetical protein EYF80_020263 [Liparis tanakae]|uniref:Uncharacterized protein n=1 Tax=Liparis tanakae TaxID=230148 RepID=A0A4Z2HUD2_9TELE|nr:hypothetical protein EYF80_020263 [Liparis tanakae]
MLRSEANMEGLGSPFTEAEGRDTDEQQSLTRADECQRVTRQLPTGAGNGTAADQHHDPRVGQPSVPVQPGELQSLRNRGSEKKGNTEEMRCDGSEALRVPDLVDGQVDARVRDDAEQVGDVAFVEGRHAFSLKDVFGTVGDS